MTNQCLFCNSKNARVRRERLDVPYKDTTVRVRGFETTLCSDCGEAYATTVQSRGNDRRVADAKREYDGVQTSDEVRALRESWGMTQQEASEIFGGGANSFSKYERGEVAPSAAMSMLLRVYDKFPQVREFILSQRLADRT